MLLLGELAAASGRCSVSTLELTGAGTRGTSSGCTSQAHARAMLHPKASQYPQRPARADRATLRRIMMDLQVAALRARTHKSHGWQDSPSSTTPSLSSSQLLQLSG